MIDFFFQAEDGIRDGTVTGVQTCALPIWWIPARLRKSKKWLSAIAATSQKMVWSFPSSPLINTPVAWSRIQKSSREIGRASCRERVDLGGHSINIEEIVHDVF